LGYGMCEGLAVGDADPGRLGDGGEETLVLEANGAPSSLSRDRSCFLASRRAWGVGPMILRTIMGLTAHARREKLDPRLAAAVEDHALLRRVELLERRIEAEADVAGQRFREAREGLLRRQVGPGGDRPFAER